VNDDPLCWKIAALRGDLLELGSAVRQLNKSGLDSAAAQLLLVRKRAELEDLMKLVRVCMTSRSADASRNAKEWLRRKIGSDLVRHFHAVMALRMASTYSGFLWI
jgi:hypothetical protein